MKILIIQQKMIGDVLISSILCENIKKNLQDTEVHYLINSNTKAVVSNNPYVDQILLFTPEHRQSKRSFYRFLQQVKAQKYHAVIDIYSKLESNCISFFSKAPIKISLKKWYSSFVYTHYVEKSKNRPIGVGYAIEDRLLFLAPLIPALKAPVKKPIIYLTDTEMARAKDFLLSHDVDFSKPIIMLGILGSAKNKTYPLPYMAELIDKVASKTDATLLFNYIPSQHIEAKKLYDLCGADTKKKVKFRAFSDSLRPFLALLSHCKALIGNEGGAVNMAKALNIPTFSIFSPWITKAAWDTFADDTNIAVHLNDYKPEIFKGKSKKELQKETREIYPLFKPELYDDRLEHFLSAAITLPNQ